MGKRDVAMFFKTLGACEDGMEWASQVDNLKTVWETCKRSDWMLWALQKIGAKDDRKMRLYACACIRTTPLADGRTVWDLLTDGRSMNAVEVAEQYAEGRATEEERAAAREAARAAIYDVGGGWDVDYAARAAALVADSGAGRAVWAASYAAMSAASAAAYAAYESAYESAREAAREVAYAAQARLLHQFLSWSEVDEAIGKYKATHKEV